MKPHWQTGAQGNADLEALQTDVMRFIAIIGLCLAAIFSLVNSAQQEITTPLPESSPVSEQADPGAAIPPSGSRKPAPTTVKPEAEAEPVTALPAGPPAIASPPTPTPAPVTPAPSPGFSLEFASQSALSQLLVAGQVQLFAASDADYWVHRSGGFYPADPPARIYTMLEQTVPRPLRLLAQGLALPQPLAWGVTLPEETTREIQALMQGREGGSLLIHADGTVNLE